MKKFRYLTRPTSVWLVLSINEDPVIQEQTNSLIIYIPVICIRVWRILANTVSCDFFLLSYMPSLRWLPTSWCGIMAISSNPSTFKHHRKRDSIPACKHFLGIEVTRDWNKTGASVSSLYLYYCSTRSYNLSRIN